jgi:MoxR-like ATPase
MDRPSLMPEHVDVRDALVVAVRAGVPVLLWGPPGEGKSRSVETLAEAMGWHSETVVGSIREASDFAGLPERTPEGIVLHAPRWAHRCAAADRAILFLDELTTATPPVQAAMLRVVLDREVGDLRLPETVSIVAAANPPDQAADGYELAPPLANRFCHLWFQADLDLWVDGLADDWSAPIQIEVAAEAQESDRATVRARWNRDVSLFLRDQPSAFRTEVTAETGSGAWASPRTWHLAARLGAAADLAGVRPSVTALLLAGTVGDGTALEFLDHRERQDDYRCLRVLVEVDHVPFPPDLDQLWVPTALHHMVQLVTSDPDRERWNRAVIRMVQAANAYGADVALEPTRRLLELRDRDWPLPAELEQFGATLNQVGE